MTYVEQAASPRSRWLTVTIGEVCSKPQYGWTTKATTEGGRIRLLRTTDITSGTIDWSRVPFCTEVPPDLEKYLVREGDIVISRAGSVGVSHLLTRIEPSVFASYLIRFRPGPEVEARYLAYFLKSPAYWRQIADSTSGIAIPNVNASKLQDVRLPLAPLVEQCRIVAEIEKQFSRLDQAVANLQRVKASLRRYEASTLKAALTGQLVPNEADLARAQKRNFESADELLQRVRRSELKAGGGRRGATEPATDVGELPALPAGWSWAQLSSITTIKGGITVDRKRADVTARPVPYLRVANVQRGHLDLGEVKFIDAPAADIDALQLMRGDILFNEGGDRDKLGRGWIWEGQLPECIHQNHVFRARPISADISPKLISWWGNTFGKDYFQREGKQTTNLASINLSKLSKFPVPVPPLAEQHRIVAEVDRRLSIVREVEAEVDSNLRRAQALRQAVLARAFSGSLNGLDRT